MSEIRVLIADDNEGIRSMLRRYLERHDDIAVVGEAHDGQQAIEAARTLQPDVMILDVRMPVLDGWEALPRILADVPTCRVLLFTADEGMEPLALSLGAAGVMLKGLDRIDPAREIRTAFERDR